MKAWLMGALLFATNALAIPNLIHAVPDCVDNINALPIFTLEIASAAEDTITFGKGTTWLLGTHVWMTAAHVIPEDVIDISIHGSSSTHIPTTLAYIDREADVAILIADSGDLTPFVLAVDVDVGDIVYTIGFPGFSGGVMRSYTGIVHGTIAAGILTSSFITTGMSGGPVLQCNGGNVEVVGMQTAYTVVDEIRTLIYKGEQWDMVTQSNSGEGIFVVDLLSHLARATEQ